MVWATEKVKEEEVGWTMDQEEGAMYTRDTPVALATLENTHTPAALLVLLQPLAAKLDPAVRYVSEVYAMKVAPEGMLKPEGEEHVAEEEPW